MTSHPEGKSNPRGIILFFPSLALKCSLRPIVQIDESTKTRSYVAGISPSLGPRIELRAVRALYY